MPQSPFHTIVYAPISNLNVYKESLVTHRVQYDNDEDVDKDDIIYDLLSDGDKVIKQCEFLESKLDNKKLEYNQLVEELDRLKQADEALIKENQAQKTEITELQSELEKARTTTAIEEQLGINVERKAEKHSEDEGSLKTERKTNLRKRDAPVDAAVGRRAVKKQRKNGRKK